MEGLKTICASWSAPELTVDCPYCGEYQGNIIENWDEWWVDFGEACTSGHDFKDQKLECEDCRKTFIINETSY